jgi:hypothetical protein
MDYSDFQSTLNIRLGDTDDFTFTPEEKEEALNEAFNDDYVTTPIWDTSLTYSVGTYQYAKPSGVDVVQDIYIKPDNNLDEPEAISSNLWEVVGDNIQFKRGSTIIPDGWTLYIKGKTKATVDDTINQTSLQEYILNLAQRHCLKLLGTKKSLRFLKNDTSLSEVIAWKRELDSEVATYRRKQPVAFESA